MKVRLFFLIIVLLFVLVLGGRQTPAAQAYAPILVDTLIDENDGKCDDGDCSLRDAINLVPTGATIDIPLSGTIELTLGELMIGKNMMIRGPGHELLTISGNNVSRVFNIGSRMSVTLRDLTIANGYTDKNGGGIYNIGSLTLEGCTLYNNTAEKAGGGVYNHYSYGKLEVKGCSFIENHADYGGGLYNLSAKATLWNCTFSGNVADVRGGGMESDRYLLNALSTVEIKHCIFSGNTNGGVTNTASNTTALNTIIAGNLGYDCLGDFLSGTTYNLSTDYTCDPGFSTVPFDWLHLAWDGWMYALEPGSQAIDTATNTGCLSTDQLDNPRPVDGNGDGVAVCDVGPYEAPAPPPPAHRLFLPLARK